MQARAARWFDALGLMPWHAPSPRGTDPWRWPPLRPRSRRRTCVAGARCGSAADSVKHDGCTRCSLIMPRERTEIESLVQFSVRQLKGTGMMPRRITDHRQRCRATVK
eukprot:543260-Prorocentrum_minimum.AAC.2